MFYNLKINKKNANLTGSANSGVSQEFDLMGQFF